VTATATVAIVGAISTPVVAIAGYVFHEVSARRDRSAALDLARENNTHELQVRRRERIYDDLKSTYRAALEWALLIVQGVQLTDPIITMTNTPAPPEEPPDEVWNAMRINVSVFGSPEVEKALDDFRAAARSFFINAGVVDMLQRQGVQSGNQGLIDALQQREDRRAEAADAYDRLATQIKAELAAL